MLYYPPPPVCSFPGKIRSPGSVMKIIYLYQYFATPGMTGGSFPYVLAKWLVGRGHEVHVVTSDTRADRSGWRETVEAGIHVHWRGVPYSNRMSYGRRLKAFAQFAWDAARRTARLPGEVIYAGSPPLTIALPAVHAARRKKVPLVFEVCDQWPATAIAAGALRSAPMIAAAKSLEKFAYRNSSHIVALSPDTKDGIVATGQSAERITTVPNRVNLDTFDVPEEQGHDFRAARDWLANRPLVVYTGSLGLVNGCEYLARLAAEVRKLDPEVRFLLVGTGREEEKVRGAAAELGVLDETFFMEPPVPVTEIPAVLSAADMATSPVIDRKPLWACSPSKLVDTLAASRPIVINHEGWIADIIRRNDCGLVLDPYDVQSASGELVNRIRDPIWTARARTSARLVAEEEFDHRKLLVQIETILANTVRQTCERPRRKAA